MNLIRFILAKGLNRTSVEIVLDLIYVTTDLLFPADKITFGDPVEINIHPNIAEEINTFVPASVAMEYDSRYTVTKNDNLSYKDGRIDGFLYRRIPLSLLTPNAGVFLIEPTTYPFRIHDILADINAKLNSKLQPDDLVDTVYPEAVYSIRLQANPHSLVWLGETELFFDIDDGRVLEDGSLRITEDGLVRDLELEIKPA